MNKIAFLFACMPLAFATTSAAFDGPAQAHGASARPDRSLAALPFAFEVNVGQVDPAIRFLSRGGSSYSISVTPTQLIVGLTKSASGRTRGDARADAARHARLNVIGVDCERRLQGGDPIPGKSNYFIGNDPANWHVDVANFRTVRCQGAYPGIDIVYYAAGTALEYDFIIAPGASMASIAMTFQDTDSASLDADGNLHLRTAYGDLVGRKPRIYQEFDGERIAIDGGYALRESTIGFDVGDYDPTRPLIIDPVLEYIDFFPSQPPGGLEGTGIATDPEGNVYVTGFNAVAYPNPLSGANPSFQYGGSGDLDTFVAKVNSSGELVYVTYLGGTERDQSAGIAVDVSGNAYVTGTTNSPDFPVLNPAQATYGGPADPWASGDVFVSKLDSGGDLRYSTFLGGSASEGALAIAVDGAGSAYIGGWIASLDFPQGKPIAASCTGFSEGVVNDEGNLRECGFVLKLSASGAVVYQIAVPAGRVSAIAVDAGGNAYFGGWCCFGAVPERHFEFLGSGTPSSGFVGKVNPAGTAFVYAKNLGISVQDFAISIEGIAVDRAGNAVVVGSTNGPLATTGGFQPRFGGNQDGFIAKINVTGDALIYSSHLGGSDEDSVHAIALDSEGSAYVGGRALSTDFPTVDAIVGGNDSFISKIAPDGSSLVFSTLLPLLGYNDFFLRPVLSIAVVDCSHNIYFTGSEVLVGRISMGPPRPIAQLSRDLLWFFNQPLNVPSAPQQVTLLNTCDEPLTLIETHVLGPFSAVDDCGTRPATIAPGGSCSFWVRFIPTMPGFSRGWITLIHPAEEAHLITLHGFTPGKVGPCDDRPWDCPGPTSMGKERLQLLCGDHACRVIDPVETNCLVKEWGCPRCPAGTPCPGFFNAFFEGLGDHWNVGVYDTGGRKVDFKAIRTKDATVVTFRPTKDHFVNGEITNYYFRFDMTAKGVPGRKYDIRSQLETGDRPYRPGKPDSKPSR